MSLLTVKNLSISIANKEVCNGLTLELNAGEVWGLLGSNGIGKTTLLHTLCHLRDEYSGDICISNESIETLKRKDIAKKIGIQLQHTEDTFPSTVLETVLIGRHPYISNWQWEDKNDFKIAMDALATVEMDKLAQRPVNNLSGGERQRVTLATLITQNPEIFLLDEPNSHLDLSYQMKLLQHFTDYSKAQQHLTMMSLHDINLAARFCTHILMLTGEGKFIAGTIESVLNQKNLTETFKHPIREIADSGKRIFIPA